MALDDSASQGSHILIGQFKQKPSESCQKYVKSGHKLFKNFCPSGNDTMYSTARMSLFV